LTTEFVKIDFNKDLESQLTGAAEIIRRGGLVAFPTETVYGLGANALDPDAAARIYLAKGRPSDNPLIIHISKPEEAEKYCFVNDIYSKIASAFMPGPITVIMKKKDIIPSKVTGGLDTVAVRCPSDPVARKLIELSAVPIAAPSANTSGKPSPTCAEHVRDDLEGKIDLIIDGGSCQIGLESTIVKVSDGKVSLLRPGGITVEMLEKVVGEVNVDRAVRERLPENVRPEAPGMKYRHYAPEAKVFLIIDDGTPGFVGRAAEYINSRIAEDPRTGALCCSEICEKLRGKYIKDLGPKTDKTEHAKHLFAYLREFDDTDVSVIYAVTEDESGIGLAVRNRMLKASGYNIIEI